MGYLTEVRLKIIIHVQRICTIILYVDKEEPPTVRTGKHGASHDLKGSRRVGGPGHEIGDGHLIEQQRAVFVVFQVEVDLQSIKLLLFRTKLLVSLTHFVILMQACISYKPDGTAYIALINIIDSGSSSTSRDVQRWYILMYYIWLIQ